MCGRYAVYAPCDTIKQYFGLSEGFVLDARYNVAPGERVPLVAGPVRHIEFKSWGFIPDWAKEAPRPIINARIETILTKPYFRESARKRRGLVIVSGYFEWRETGRRKQPYFISGPTPLMGLGAVWEGDTMAIVTKPAIASMAFLHERMPLIVPADQFSEWLNPKAKYETVWATVESVEPMLQAVPVSTVVNDPKHDSPWCVEPINSREMV